MSSDPTSDSMGDPMSDSMGDPTSGAARGSVSGVGYELDTTLREALERFAAHESVLIALDFDGTLAPEVDDPEAARALPDAHDALVRLGLLPATTVALISGRSLVSLEAVAGMPAHMPLVGSHGLELRFGPGDNRPAVNDADRSRVIELRSRLSPLVDATSEAWIEDKPAGFAVHTRLVEASAASVLHDAVRAEALHADATPRDSASSDSAPRDSAPRGSAPPDATPRGSALTKAAPINAAPRDAPVTVRDGKNVIEFSVRDATKGDGLDALRERFAPDAVLFAGDDVTDEDALASLRSGDVGIKVGSATTVADHRLADPRAVASMLRILAELRAR